MNLRSRLARLEERHAPEAAEPEYLTIRIVRRLVPGGELISERQLRFRQTPAGLVRVEEPNPEPEGQP
jgi:hypothetical protein